MLALPSAKAAQIALRTQQLIMEETGVMNVADPLGGSWYVEALTDEMERQAEEIFTRIKDMSADGTMTSGILRGIEDGWFTGEIAEAAFVYQRALEKGDKKVVGVNTLTGSVEAHDTLDILRVEPPGGDRPEGRARRAPQSRDDDAARAAVAHMVEVGRTDANMLPAMLDAVRAEATLGEICDALRAEWGNYTEPARFLRCWFGAGANSGSRIPPLTPSRACSSVRVLGVGGTVSSAADRSVQHTGRSRCGPRGARPRAHPSPDAERPTGSRGDGLDGVGDVPGRRRAAG